MIASSNGRELSFQNWLAGSRPALGREEEVELARRWRNHGDRRAADALVRAHLRTVTSLAVKYRHYGVPTAELVAEGNCGLVHALGKFDPERGIRFVTYAVHWIRAQMLAYVMRSRSLVGGAGGPIRSHLYFKLRRERARVNALLGESDASRAALAERLGMPLERLLRLLERLDATDVSLDLPASLDQTYRAIDFLAADEGEDPEQHLARAVSRLELNAAVAAGLGGLDARERLITDRRLMAAPEEELSLAELARKLGISRERARQLEVRAKRKLRKALRALDPTRPELPTKLGPGGQPVTSP